MTAQPGRQLWLFLLCVLTAAPLPANDWSRFRGPAGAGFAAASLPLELAEDKNLRWKTSCGKGASSPIVAKGKVFLTSLDGDQRVVECFDAATGTRAWAKSIEKQRTEHSTPPGGPATSSPVADDKNVYAFFADFGLVCYSHEGDEQWRVPLGPFQSFHGIASSLVAAEGRLFVLVDQLNDSFMAAYDAATGAEVWKVKREDGPIGGYSTPATRTNARGRLELVVSGPLEVVGYDAATGARNWTLAGATSAPISVPLISGSRVFVCEPSFTQNPFPIDALLRHDADKDGQISVEEVATQPPLLRIVKRIDASWGNGDGKISAAEMDKAFESFISGGGLAAIEIDEQGPAATASLKWNYRRSVPQIPSLLAKDNVLFFVHDGGILTTMNADTGEVHKRARVGSGAKYYASPVAAGDRILLLDTEGQAAVVTAEAQWQVLATSDLKDRCYATPAIVEGSLFIRGDVHLYCFSTS